MIQEEAGDTFGFSVVGRGMSHVGMPNHVDTNSGNQASRFRLCPKQVEELAIGSNQLLNGGIAGIPPRLRFGHKGGLTQASLDQIDRWCQTFALGGGFVNAKRGNECIVRCVTVIVIRLWVQHVLRVSEGSGTTHTQVQTQRIRKEGALVLE